MPSIENRATDPIYSSIPAVAEFQRRIDTKYGVNIDVIAERTRQIIAEREQLRRETTQEQIEPDIETAAVRPAHAQTGIMI